MSLKDKASLIFKPSRYKAGTAYSFRGTDFTFTRASTATRINSAGNIEEVASGVPRLNYDGTDLTKEPVILLEHESTNYLTDSNTGGFGSTDVANGTSLTKNGIEGISRSDAGGGNPRIYLNVAMATGFNVFSFYVDLSTITSSLDIRLGIDGNASTGLRVYVFKETATISTPTIYNTSNVNSGSEFATLEQVKGSIYRISLGGNFAAGTNIFPVIYFGAGASNSWIGGGQIERRRKASSLIKTSGSTATRDFDIAKKTSASSVIGQSEGTIYVEFEYTGVKDHYSPLFSLQGVGSPMELIEIYAGINGTAYSAVMQDGGVTQFNNAFTPSIGKNKVAFAYATNNSVLVANGKVIGAVDTACTIPTLYDIGLGSFTYSSSYSLGDSINEALLFKQRLSAEELASLTSFDDYEELVDAKGLTWESSTITNNRLSELAAL